MGPLTALLNAEGKTIPESPVSAGNLAGLLKLIKLGYGKQLVVGCDIYQKIQTQGWGGHGYSRILDYLKPLLLGFQFSMFFADHLLKM